MEPLPKKKRESHGMDQKCNSDMPGKASQSSGFGNTGSAFAVKPGKLFVYFTLRKYYTSNITNCFHSCKFNLQISIQLRGI